MWRFILFLALLFAMLVIFLPDSPNPSADGGTLGNPRASECNKDNTPKSASVKSIYIHNDEKGNTDPTWEQVKAFFTAVRDALYLFPMLFLTLANDLWNGTEPRLRPIYGMLCYPSLLLMLIGLFSITAGRGLFRKLAG